MSIADVSAARIDELERQLAEAREVKPLEWSDNGRYASHDLGARFTVYYSITDLEYGLEEVGFGVHCHEFGETVIWRGPKGEGQAAAQAHYTTGILSALKGTP